MQFRACLRLASHKNYRKLCSTLFLTVFAVKVCQLGLKMAVYEFFSIELLRSTISAQPVYRPREALNIIRITPRSSALYNAILYGKIVLAQYRTQGFSTLMRVVGIFRHTETLCTFVFFYAVFNKQNSHSKWPKTPIILENMLFLYWPNTILPYKMAL